MKNVCCSDFQSLSAIVAVLQGILGKDDRKWKMFIKFWRSWGHPRPFSNEDEAKKIVSAVDLFRLLDLRAARSDLKNNAKVKLITSRRHFLLETAECLLDSSETENTEIKGSLLSIYFVYLHI